MSTRGPGSSVSASTYRRDESNLPGVPRSSAVRTYILFCCTYLHTTVCVSILGPEPSDVDTPPLPLLKFSQVVEEFPEK